MVDSTQTTVPPRRKRRDIIDVCTPKETGAKISEAGVGADIAKDGVIDGNPGYAHTDIVHQRYPMLCMLAAVAWALAVGVFFFLLLTM